MTNTEIIKKYILDLELDVVGIATPERMANEPEGRGPLDILPNCKSIIVFGYRVIDGVTQSLFRGFEDNNKFAQGIYGTHGYEMAPNFLLMYNSFKIAEFIERKFGEVAVALPSGPLQNGVCGRDQMPQFCGPVLDGLPFNLNNAAVAAGLGEYGWNNRVLTPEHGPRIKFGCVLSSIELTPDAPYSGPRLCNPEECGICVNICPTCALPAPGTEDAKVEILAGKEQQMAPFKLNRCMVAACALRTEFGSMSGDLVSNLDPTTEELEAAFKKKVMESTRDATMIDHNQKWKCDRCLAYCPVGGWKEKFQDKQLTKC